MLCVCVCVCARACVCAYFILTSYSHIVVVMHVALYAVLPSQLVTETSMVLTLLHATPRPLPLPLFLGGTTEEACADTGAVPAQPDSTPGGIRGRLPSVVQGNGETE